MSRSMFTTERDMNPCNDHYRVALRGGFGAILHCRPADEWDRDNNGWPSYGEGDCFISFDLYTDTTFANLLAEDIGSLDIDDAFFQELMSAKQVSPAASATDALCEELKAICLAQAPRSELATLGVA